jgi:hypothetical protein
MLNLLSFGGKVTWLTPVQYVNLTCYPTFSVNEPIPRPSPTNVAAHIVGHFLPQFVISQSDPVRCASQMIASRYNGARDRARVVCTQCHERKVNLQALCTLTLLMPTCL